MESLHRTGSQARLKIPGARWLLETSQALFNTRMLYLCGRWDEFWHQPGLHHELVEVFSSEPQPASDQHDPSVVAEKEGLDAAA